jgi:hypothetical protein
MDCYSESKYQRTWRPLSIADANRWSVSWSRRNAAKDKLDDLTFDYQKIAAASALGRNVQASELKCKPQRGPLHTSYPAFPAARSCLGLSAVSEFKAQAGNINVLLQRAVNLEPEKMVSLDPKAVSQTSSFVVEAVANRLCLDQLYRMEGLEGVESYRLFAAAMIDLRFTRLKDVILGACTLGDLIFGLIRRKRIRRKLHPLTCRILEALAPACDRYQVAAANCSFVQLTQLGADLAKEIMEALVPFLPFEQSVPPVNTPNHPVQPPRRPPRRVPVPKNRPRVPDEKVFSQPLAGMDEPVPPSIGELSPWRLRPDPEKPKANNRNSNQDGGQIPKDTTPSVDRSINNKETFQEGPSQNNARLQPLGASSQMEMQVLAILQHTASVISTATSRSRWDDPRVDQVAQLLRNTLFLPGTVEAELAAQRQKVTAYGSDRKGDIQEEVLSRCRDAQALLQVRQGAFPIEKKLRGYKWFGQRYEAMADRLQTRGGLDPHRLHRLATSPLLHRRWRRRSVVDYRGKPLVVLAKDGSSSNTLHTTFAGKILAAAFLRVQKQARIRLFVADYSSGRGGPLVRWLYHPQKTPGRSSYQAAEAVASLPPKGQGGNEDVLSISYIMREVLTLPSSNKQNVIVINVTDGKFNSPIKQFRSMISKLREDYRLTYSLVILGNTSVNVPEADHIISIPDSELQDPHQIAERIAKHINVLVRNLRGRARSRYG